MNHRLRNPRPPQAGCASIILKRPVIRHEYWRTIGPQSAIGGLKSLPIRSIPRRLRIVCFNKDLQIMIRPDFDNLLLLEAVRRKEFINFLR